MANPKPPPQPSAYLLAACADLRTMAERETMGPWDVLPATLRVEVPIPHPFAQDLAKLSSTYGLAEQAAAEHAALCRGELDVLVSKAQIERARSLAQGHITGEENHHIWDAAHPDITRLRLEAMRPILLARRQEAQDAAEAEVRAEVAREASAFVQAGWRAYSVRAVAITGLQAWWASRLTPRHPPRARCHVFPELPLKVSVADCVEMANIVDVEKGFPSMGTMPERLFHRAAVAAIIGAYKQELERVVGEAPPMPVNEIHKRLWALLEDLVAYMSGDFSKRAGYVFARVPGLVLLSQEAKAGRGSSLDSLAGCDTEKFLRFLEWADTLMGRVAVKPRTEASSTADDDLEGV